MIGLMSVLNLQRLCSWNHINWLKLVVDSNSVFEEQCSFIKQNGLFD